MTEEIKQDDLQESPTPQVIPTLRQDTVILVSLDNKKEAEEKGEAVLDIIPIEEFNEGKILHEKKYDFSITIAGAQIIESEFSATLRPIPSASQLQDDDNKDNVLIQTTLTCSSESQIVSKFREDDAQTVFTYTADRSDTSVIKELKKSFPKHEPIKEDLETPPENIENLPKGASEQVPLQDVEQEPLEQAPTDEGPLDGAPPDQAPPDQAPPDQAPPDQAPPDQEPPDQAPPDQASTDEGPLDGAPPDQAPPDQELPDQAPPDQEPPDQAPPDQASTDEGPLDGAPPDQAPPDQAPSDEAPPDQAPPDQAPPDEAPPDEAPPDQAPPDQAPPDQAPPDQAPPDQAPPDQAPPDQAPPDQAPPDQAPPDQAPPDQAPPDQAPPDQAPPDQAPPDEAPPDQAPPDQAQPDQAPPDQAPPKEEPPEAPPKEASTVLTTLEQAPTDDGPLDGAPPDQAPLNDKSPDEAPLDEAPLDEALPKEEPKPEMTTTKTPQTSPSKTDIAKPTISTAGGKCAQVKLEIAQGINDNKQITLDVWLGDCSYECKTQNEKQVIEREIAGDIEIDKELPLDVEGLPKSQDEARETTKFPSIETDTDIKTSEDEDITSIAVKSKSEQIEEKSEPTENLDIPTKDTENDVTGPDELVKTEKSVEKVTEDEKDIPEPSESKADGITGGTLENEKDEDENKISEGDQTVRDDETDDKSLGFDTVQPVQTPEEQAPPDQAPPDKASTDEGPLDGAPPDQAAPDQAPTDEGPLDGAPPDQAPPDQAPPDQASTDEGPLDGAPPDQEPPDQAPPDQAPPDQAPPDQAPPDQASTDEGPLDGAPPDQAPPDQAPTDEGPLDGAPPDQSPPDQAPPDQAPPDETDETINKDLTEGDKEISTFGKQAQRNKMVPCGGEIKLTFGEGCGQIEMKVKRTTQSVKDMYFDIKLPECSVICPYDKSLKVCQESPLAQVAGEKETDTHSKTPEQPDTTLMPQTEISQDIPVDTETETSTEEAAASEQADTVVNMSDTEDVPEEIFEEAIENPVESETEDLQEEKFEDTVDIPVDSEIKLPQEMDMIEMPESQVEESPTEVLESTENSPELETEVITEPQVEDLLEEIPDTADRPEESEITPEAEPADAPEETLPELALLSETQMEDSSEVQPENPIEMEISGDTQVEDSSDLKETVEELETPEPPVEELPSDSMDNPPESEPEDLSKVSEGKIKLDDTEQQMVEVEDLISKDISEALPTEEHLPSTGQVKLPEVKITETKLIDGICSGPCAIAPNTNIPVLKGETGIALTVNEGGGKLQMTITSGCEESKQINLNLWFPPCADECKTNESTSKEPQPKFQEGEITDTMKEEYKSDEGTTENEVIDQAMKEQDNIIAKDDDNEQGKGMENVMEEDKNEPIVTETDTEIEQEITQDIKEGSKPTLISESAPEETENEGDGEQIDNEMPESQEGMENVMEEDKNEPIVTETDTEIEQEITQDIKEGSKPTLISESAPEETENEGDGEQIDNEMPESQVEESPTDILQSTENPPELETEVITQSQVEDLSEEISETTERPEESEIIPDTESPTDDKEDRESNENANVITLQEQEIAGEITSVTEKEPSVHSSTEDLRTQLEDKICTGICAIGADVKISPSMIQQATQGISVIIGDGCGQAKLNLTKSDELSRVLHVGLEFLDCSEVCAQCKCLRTTKDEEIDLGGIASYPEINISGNEAVKAFPGVSQETPVGKKVQLMDQETDLSSIVNINTISSFKSNKMNEDIIMEWAGGDTTLVDITIMKVSKSTTELKIETWTPALPKSQNKRIDSEASSSIAASGTTDAGYVTDLSDINETTFKTTFTDRKESDDTSEEKSKDRGIQTDIVLGALLTSDSISSMGNDNTASNEKSSVSHNGIQAGTTPENDTALEPNYEMPTNRTASEAFQPLSAGNNLTDPTTWDPQYLDTIMHSVPWKEDYVFYKDVETNAMWENNLIIDPSEIEVQLVDTLVPLKSVSSAAIDNAEFIIPTMISTDETKDALDDNDIQVPDWPTLDENATANDYYYLPMGPAISQLSTLTGVLAKRSPALINIPIDAQTWGFPSASTQRYGIAEDDYYSAPSEIVPFDMLPRVSSYLATDDDDAVSTVFNPNISRPPTAQRAKMKSYSRDTPSLDSPVIFIITMDKDSAENRIRVISEKSMEEVNNFKFQYEDAQKTNDTGIKCCAHAMQFYTSHLKHSGNDEFDTELVLKSSNELDMKRVMGFLMDSSGVVFEETFPVFETGVRDKFQMPEDVPAFATTTSLNFHFEPKEKEILTSEKIIIESFKRGLKTTLLLSFKEKSDALGISNPQCTGEVTHFIINNNVQSTEESNAIGSNESPVSIPIPLGRSGKGLVKLSTISSSLSLLASYPPPDIMQNVDRVNEYDVVYKVVAGSEEQSEIKELLPESPPIIILIPFKRPPNKNIPPSAYQVVNLISGNAEAEIGAAVKGGIGDQAEIPTEKQGTPASTDGKGDLSLEVWRCGNKEFETQLEAKAIDVSQMTVFDNECYGVSMSYFDTITCYNYYSLQGVGGGYKLEMPVQGGSNSIDFCNMRVTLGNIQEGMDGTEMTVTFTDLSGEPKICPAHAWKKSIIEYNIVKDDEIVEQVFKETVTENSPLRINVPLDSEYAKAFIKDLSEGKVEAEVCCQIMINGVVQTEDKKTVSDLESPFSFDIPFDVDEGNAQIIMQMRPLDDNYEPQLPETTNADRQFLDIKESKVSEVPITSEIEESKLSEVDITAEIEELKLPEVPVVYPPPVAMFVPFTSEEETEKSLSKSPAILDEQNPNWIESLPQTRDEDAIGIPCATEVKDSEDYENENPIDGSLNEIQRQKELQSCTCECESCICKKTNISSALDSQPETLKDNTKKLENIEVDTNITQENIESPDESVESPKKNVASMENIQIKSEQMDTDMECICSSCTCDEEEIIEEKQADDNQIQQFWNITKETSETRNGEIAKPQVLTSMKTEGNAKPNQNLDICHMPQDNCKCCKCINLYENADLGTKEISSFDNKVPDKPIESNEGRGIIDHSASCNCFSCIDYAANTEVDIEEDIEDGAQIIPEICNCPHCSCKFLQSEPIGVKEVTEHSTEATELLGVNETKVQEENLNLEKETKVTPTEGTDVDATCICEVCVCKENSLEPEPEIIKQMETQAKEITAELPAKHSDDCPCEMCTCQAENSTKETATTSVHTEDVPDIENIESPTKDITSVPPIQEAQLTIKDNESPLKDVDSTPTRTKNCICLDCICHPEEIINVQGAPIDDFKFASKHAEKCICLECTCHSEETSAQSDPIHVVATDIKTPQDIGTVPTDPNECICSECVCDADEIRNVQDVSPQDVKMLTRDNVSPNGDIESPITDIQSSVGNTESPPVQIDDCICLECTCHPDEITNVHGTPTEGLKSTVKDIESPVRDTEPVTKHTNDCICIECICHASEITDVQNTPPSPNAKLATGIDNTGSPQDTESAPTNANDCICLECTCHPDEAINVKGTPSQDLLMSNNDTVPYSIENTLQDSLRQETICICSECKCDSDEITNTIPEQDTVREKVAEAGATVDLPSAERRLCANVEYTYPTNEGEISESKVIASGGSPMKIEIPIGMNEYRATLIISTELRVQGLTSQAIPTQRIFNEEAQAGLTVQYCTEFHTGTPDEFKRILENDIYKYDKNALSRESHLRSMFNTWESIQILFKKQLGPVNKQMEMLLSSYRRLDTYEISHEGGVCFARIRNYDPYQGCGQNTSQFSALQQSLDYDDKIFNIYPNEQSSNVLPVSNVAKLRASRFVDASNVNNLSLLNDMRKNIGHQQSVELHETSYEQYLDMPIPEVLNSERITNITTFNKLGNYKKGNKQGLIAGDIINASTGNLHKQSLQHDKITDPGQYTTRPCEVKQNFSLLSNDDSGNKLSNAENDMLWKHSKKSNGVNQEKLILNNSNVSYNESLNGFKYHLTNKGSNTTTVQKRPQSYPLYSRNVSPIHLLRDNDDLISSSPAMAINFNESMDTQLHIKPSGTFVPSHYKNVYTDKLSKYVCEKAASAQSRTGKRRAVYNPQLNRFILGYNTSRGSILESPIDYHIANKITVPAGKHERTSLIQPQIRNGKEYKIGIQSRETSSQNNDKNYSGIWTQNHTASRWAHNKNNFYRNKSSRQDSINNYSEAFHQSNTIISRKIDKGRINISSVKPSTIKMRPSRSVKDKCLSHLAQMNIALSQNMKSAVLFEPVKQRYRPHTYPENGIYYQRGYNLSLQKQGFQFLGQEDAKNQSRGGAEKEVNYFFRKASKINGMKPEALWSTPEDEE